MPDQDKLRAAAGEITKAGDQELSGAPVIQISRRLWDCSVSVARAYLAHPPLTRERVEKAVGELVGPYKSGLFDPAELADGLCRLLGVDSP